MATERCHNPCVPPSVSVVVPVLNGMPYLKDSLGSILSQTFEDFELVVLDNGSDDDTLDFARSLAAVDQRVKVYSEPQPLGMVGSSNAVIEKASADLVARMDADDVSSPLRLERQVDLLRSRPDAVLVGILGDGIDGSGKHVKPRDRSRLLDVSGLAPCDHGSIMFRRDVFERAGGYRPGTEGYEDQDLYRRISQYGKLLILTERLFSYRFHLSNWTTGFLDRYEGNAYAQLAAQRVWAGARAPRFRLSMLRGCSPARGAQILLYGTWGCVSPRSLRFILAELVRVRDRRAVTRLQRMGREEPYEWSFSEEGKVTET